MLDYLNLKLLTIYKRYKQFLFFFPFVDEAVFWHTIIKSDFKEYWLICNFLVETKEFEWPT